MADTVNVSLKTINERFLALMFKEVAANVGGQTIVAPQYELFLGEMIKAGIRGNTSARRLVVDFLLGLQAREAGQKTDETQRETEGESPEVVVSWDCAKERLLKAAGLKTED